MLPTNIRSSANAALPASENDMASNWTPGGIPFAYSATLIWLMNTCSRSPFFLSVTVTRLIAALFENPGAYQVGRAHAAHVRSRCPGVPALRGRLRLVALIEQASVIQRILRTSGCPRTSPSRDLRGHHPDTWTSPTISRKTPVNSMPPGEGDPSCQERCRRWTPTLVPTRSPLPTAAVSPATRLRAAVESGANDGLIRLSKGEGPSESENGRYANSRTALIFPIVFLTAAPHGTSTTISADGALTPNLVRALTRTK